MKNTIFIFFLIISNNCFAQKNVFENLPYWIGDKVDIMKILDPIKINSKYFKEANYSLSNDSIYYLKLQINKYKNIEEIENFLMSNKNIIKASHLNWNISFENCFIDKLNDIQYLIKYNFRDDPTLTIISFKINDDPFYKNEDKFKKQITYISDRYSYLGLSYQKNIDLNFRFGPTESTIYGILDFYYDKWYFLKTIYFLLDNDEVVKKELSEINRKVLSSDFIKESNFFELSFEEAYKINQSEKIEIKIEGSENNVEYQIVGFPWLELFKFPKLL
ncbi:hypothetical protein [Mariniflexile sp. AS56]|uniref:hypothetical protein n=1 Tax=Mariniflexile sp. AS56 TaxID=3063957 RepID=UPI00398AE586